MRCYEKLRDANLGRPCLLQVQAPLSVTVTTDHCTSPPCRAAKPAQEPKRRWQCHWQTPEIRNLESRIAISDLRSWISNLESRMSNLGSWMISDLGSRISSLGSRISNLESRISDLRAWISNLEVSDLGSRIHSAHLPRQTCKLKWCYLQQLKENSLFMTTSRRRKVGKSPFPLLSTASLCVCVCQMPLRFLDPMCTWSECAEVMLPATAWKEQLVHDNLPVQENWQVSLPTSIHSFVACVPDAPAILGSYVHMERMR